MSSSKEWSDLQPALTPWVYDAVTSFGFSQMTPVQASVIPLFRGNKDVVVEAVTGSGKTLAFLIPMIERILSLDSEPKSGQTNGIIISPTRELAEQIDKVLQSLLDFAPTAGASGKSKIIRSQLIIGGGNPTHVDLKTFLARRPHILVATPGRLLELLNQPTVYMRALEVLTLDEADRLLDLGFETTLTKIFSLMPKQKRVGLFSATISDALGEVVRVGLRNPVKVVVSSGKANRKTPRSLGINYMVVNSHERLPVLLHTIRNLEYKKAIVYFPSCISVTYFHSLLSFLLEGNSDVKLYSIHGKLQPGPRHKTLQKFTESVGQAVLFATDVAARGLDIPEVDHVLQLHPPTDPNAFLHRAGRAGRAGRDGTCTVLLSPGREETYVDFMQVRKVNMNQLELPAGLEDSLQLESNIRRWILEDRGRHDSAIRAFTAFVRFYDQHSATSIFRKNDLNLRELAEHAYYLVRLPRMPELKGIEDEETYLGPEKVDMDEYKYADPQREAARLEALEKARTSMANKKNKNKQEKTQFERNQAWSGKIEKKQQSQERRSKRTAKNLAKVKEILENGGEDSEDEDENGKEDWKDLIRQNKRAKKSKNNAVSASFDDL